MASDTRPVVLRWISILCFKFFNTSVHVTVLTFNKKKAELSQGNRDATGISGNVCRHCSL